MEQMQLMEIFNEEYIKPEKKTFPTLKEYVENVVYKSDKNSEEFKNLIKVYGLIRLQRILEGKKLWKARQNQS